VFQVFQIIGKAQAVTAGNRFQAAGDGVLVDILRNIGGVNDLRQAQQPRLFQPVFQDNGLE
jgi:hypothetical protein